MPTEWALHPAGAADLEGMLAAGLVGPARGGGLAAQGVVFSRLYWGDAFCRLLLPTRAERHEVEACGARLGLALTLATPPLPDPDLQLLAQVLGWLEPGEEVEVNDWGVLRLVAREFPHLRPVMGRMLFKALKDPRREGGARRPAVTPAIGDQLRRHGVSLVTSDILADAGDFDLALVFPYRYVSSGRICPIGSTCLATPERFSLAAACRRECRDFMLDLSTGDVRLVQKGNTVFAPWQLAEAERFRTAVAAGDIARAVYAAGVDRERAFLRAPRDAGWEAIAP